MTLGVIVWKLSAYFHNTCTAAVIKFPKNICRLKGYGVVAFSSYPWRYIKIVFTPEDFHKTWVYPLKNMGLPLKSMGLLLTNVGLLLKSMGLHMKNFTKIKDLPLKSTIVFFTLHLKKSSIFIIYSRRISLVVKQGVPMLNAIDHTVCCRKNLYLGSTSSEPTAVAISFVS